MNRGDVYLVNLNPTNGSEQQGARDCAIVSPDGMNSQLNTVIVVPLTTKLKAWPSRVNTYFRNVPGQAICEQIRTIDKKRLVKLRGSLSLNEVDEIRLILKQMLYE